MEHAVRITARAAACRLHAETALARSSRADKGDQPAGVAVEAVVDRLQLFLASDEGRHLRGQVRSTRFERAQQGEVGGQPVDLQLVDVLRRRKVLEAVLAQVSDRG